MSSPATSPAKKRAKRARAPKHAGETRAYRFPLDVTPAQEARLHEARFACWRLRNRLVQDRIENRDQVKAARAAGIAAAYLTRADQYEAVKGYAKHDQDWGALHSQVRQNVAVRVDEGCRRWFEARRDGRSGVKPPRLRRFESYRGFTYPQYGRAARIRNGRLELSGLGAFRVNAYRKIRGRKKTVTLAFAQGRWWCIVTAEIPVGLVHPPLPAADPRPDAGVDPGLCALLTDSHGVAYDPPQAWHNDRRRLARAQKTLARQWQAHDARYLAQAYAALALGLWPVSYRHVPRSKRLKAQLAVVARLHARIANVRDHHQKKTAARLADQYRQVAVEEHGVQFLLRNRRLARLAADRAIHKQTLRLKSKLGPRYVAVGNRRPGLGGNSQSCVCGAAVPKTLSERTHRCPACGLVAGRDHVAANVVQLMAFGTTSPTLQRGAGSLSTGDGEAKGGACERRVSEPARASEASVKRQPHADCDQGHTTGGEPTVAGKTSRHRAKRRSLALAPQPPGSPAGCRRL